MVPRMIAGLTSYEAERLTVGRLGNREDAKQMRYFAQDSSEGERKRRKVVVRLRDEMEEVLTYPCRTLAKLYEPLELADRSVDEVRRIVLWPCPGASTGIPADAPTSCCSTERCTSSGTHADLRWRRAEL